MICAPIVLREEKPTGNTLQELMELRYSQPPFRFGFVGSATTVCLQINRFPALGIRSKTFVVCCFVAVLHVCTGLHGSMDWIPSSYRNFAPRREIALWALPAHSCKNRGSIPDGWPSKPDLSSTPFRNGPGCLLNLADSSHSLDRSLPSDCWEDFQPVRANLFEPISASRLIAHASPTRADSLRRPWMNAFIYFILILLV